nr:MAG TPA: hypothetical protein [Bacteriophage sp.]
MSDAETVISAQFLLNICKTKLENRKKHQSFERFYV